MFLPLSLSTVQLVGTGFAPAATLSAHSAKLRQNFL